MNARAPHLYRQPPGLRSRPPASPSPLPRRVAPSASDTAAGRRSARPFAGAGSPAWVLIGFSVSLAVSAGAVIPPPGNWARDYKKWERVTAKPLHLPDATAVLCAAPSPPPEPNPHRNYHFRVYVNPTARKAMLSQKSPHFPPGSVLVKEKLASPDDPRPVLLTVMSRPEASTVGDSAWSYYVLDPDGKVKSGATDHCQRCHEKVRGQDFVFRSYLSKAQSAALH